MKKLIYQQAPFLCLNNKKFVYYFYYQICRFDLSFGKAREESGAVFVEAERGHRPVLLTHRCAP